MGSKLFDEELTNQNCFLLFILLSILKGNGFLPRPPKESKLNVRDEAVWPKHNGASDQFAINVNLELGHPIVNNSTVTQTDNFSDNRSFLYFGVTE